MTNAFSECEGVLRSIVHYSLWLITVALGVLDIFAARHLLLAAHVALRLGKWTYGLVDKVGLVIIALACIILVFLAEDWYRRLANAGWGILLKRFAVVTAGQVVLGLLGWYLV